MKRDYPTRKSKKSLACGFACGCGLRPSKIPEVRGFLLPLKLEVAPTRSLAKYLHDERLSHRDDPLLLAFDALGEAPEQLREGTNGLLGLMKRARPHPDQIANVIQSQIRQVECEYACPRTSPAAISASGFFFFFLRFEARRRVLQTVYL